MNKVNIFWMVSYQRQYLSKIVATFVKKMSENLCDPVEASMETFWLDSHFSEMVADFAIKVMKNLCDLIELLCTLYEYALTVNEISTQMNKSMMILNL